MKKKSGHISACDFVNTTNERTYSGTTVDWQSRFIIGLFKWVCRRPSKTHTQIEVIRHLVLRKILTEIQISVTLILSEIKDLLASRVTLCFALHTGTCSKLARTSLRAGTKSREQEQVVVGGDGGDSMFGCFSELNILPVVIFSVASRLKSMFCTCIGCSYTEHK